MVATRVATPWGGCGVSQYRPAPSRVPMGGKYYIMIIIIIMCYLYVAYKYDEKCWWAPSPG